MVHAHEEPGHPVHSHLPWGQQCCLSGQQQAEAEGQQPSPSVVSQHVCDEPQGLEEAHYEATKKNKKGKRERERE